ncbi:unnamed protein product [Rotaria sp. Silwood2]|nr:unnamed protein product [Rotaria sp. Silwood2]CAF4082677.1 unnamed protein product [Rotaria sp. Silwood2]
MRNALFETTLQSVAVPQSDEEQIIFNLLNEQQWILHVNLLNTEIACSSISAIQIIGSSSVPLKLYPCSNKNSIVKTSIVLSSDADTIQWIIDDFKPIGGLGLGLTGSGKESGSSMLKDLEFSQAFYNSNRTLAQAAAVSLQLTMVSENINFIEKFIDVVKINFPRRFRN